jgi:hypothetical protein
MKTRALLTCLSLFGPGGAWAASPPVEVEVVVDGDDDFFEAPAPKKAARSNAERAMDELEAEEQVRAGSKSDGANVNTNTQVVKVVVVGGEQQNKAEVAPAAAEVAPQPAVAVAPLPPPPAPSPPAGKVEAQRDWWDTDSFVKEGEFMISGLGGGHSAGGFAGMTGEGMATDQLGLRLSGMGTAFTGDMVGIGKLNGNFDILKGGVWANQRPVTRNNVEEGFAFLFDGSLVLHMLPHSMIDPYVSAGLALYGYDIKFDDRTDRGGAGYTRLGAGANIHFSRFFAGIDIGWYPVELFRYTLEERDDRGRDDDFEIQGAKIDDRFVAERYVASLHVGLRF